MSKKLKKKTETVPQDQKLIDVEKAIQSKNPKLLKWIPGFAIRYIKRILHQEELNEIIYRNRDKKRIDFVNAGVEEMGLNIVIEGLENIPKTGGVYIAANHPLGGLDGVALMHVVGQVRDDMKFFVNDLLMQVENFGPYFIPVNKHGMNGKEYKERFEKVYASDECLLIFPAGLVSRRQKGKKIEDLVWKKSIIQKAIEYQKPIVPVYIHARNSNKFYNIAYWRKKLGIKANIEMFYLADEMFKQNGKTLHFVIGKPIEASTFTEDKKPEEWSQWLKEKVYNLGKNLTHKF